MIYFLRWNDGSIKIGSTPNLTRRIKEHAAANGGVAPELLGVMDGSPVEERQLHLRFTHLRTQTETPIWERFHPVPELMEFIAANSRPWCEADDKPGGEEPCSVSIRGSTAWRDWLQRYALYKRTTPTGLLDMAVAEMAKRDKFEAPPDRIP
jgi:hypothetical protein